jgi:hypothetical protein
MLGHHDDSAVGKYTNTKDECRRLACRIPTEILDLQPSHSCHLLSIRHSAAGVGSDWRRCNAVHRHPLDPARSTNPQATIRAEGLASVRTKIDLMILKSGLEC